MESIGFGRFHVLLFVILGSSNVRTDGRTAPADLRAPKANARTSCVCACVRADCGGHGDHAVGGGVSRDPLRVASGRLAGGAGVHCKPNSQRWVEIAFPSNTDFCIPQLRFFSTCFSIFPPSDGVGILHTLRKMLFGSCSCLPVCFQMVFLGFMVCGALGGYVADRYGRWKVAHGLARRASRSLSRRGLVCVQVVYGGFVWSAYFSLLTSFAPSYAWFVFLRSMVGCGVAAVSQGSAARAPSQPPTAAFALGSASSSPLIFGAGNYLPIAPPVLFPRAPAAGTEMSQL